jgi:hypothetical protein
MSYPLHLLVCVRKRVLSYQLIANAKYRDGTGTIPYESLMKHRPLLLLPLALATTYCHYRNV